MAALGVALLANAAAHAQTVPIIPLPAHATDTHETVDISHGMRLDARGGDKETASVAAYLDRLLATSHGPRVLTTATASAPVLRFLHRSARPTPGGADESYALAISPREIRITAGSRAGYLYGAISLWQLASQAHGPLECWQIEDAPRFRWRGIMLDSARHMQDEAFLRTLLDYMAEHKLNVLHWHLVDDQGWRLEIKRYPLLTSIGAYRPQTMPPYTAHSTAPRGPYGGFYTQDQVRRIVAYAQARNITIVPEIEMPGHATAPLVAYPELRSAPGPATMPVGWGIFPNLYNPSDASLHFLQNVLLEVMALFPSPYIHLGGDEAIKDQWKHNPEIQAKIRALGLKDEDALQGWFMGQMESFLNAHGRRMVGWDEILDGGISRDATVMSWRGMQGGIAAARLGHDAVLTPSRPLYFNYRQSGATDEPPGRDPINSLEDVYKFQASPSGLSPAEQAHILGVQGSIWSEYLLTDDVLEHMLFPRAAALAEVAWTPQDERDFSSFLERLPADNQRAEDAGMRPARSVFATNATVQPDRDGTHAAVALGTQDSAAQIRYTLDGSPVSARSNVYTRAFTVTFPATLQAAAFAGTRQVGPAIREPLTLTRALARDSRELDACDGSAGIQMEQDPIRNAERPVFRVVFSHPCWMYRGAQLAHIRSVQLSVGSIPYIFHGPGRTIPPPTSAATTRASIAIHADTCSGTLLGTVPLEPAYRKDGEVRLPPVPLTVTSEQQQGAHDLCFEVQDADPATVWLLHTVQPIPGNEQQQRIQSSPGR